jgi:hypothetical protein
MSRHLQLVLTDAAPEDFRHPMWKGPDPEEELPLHIYKVRQKIAGLLPPYDDRPNSEYATSYLAYIWDISKSESHHQFLTLFLGSIWFGTEMHADRVASQVQKDILHQLGKKLCRAAYDGRQNTTP